MAKKKYTIKKAQYGSEDPKPKRKVFVQEGVEGAIPDTFSVQSAQTKFDKPDPQGDMLRAWTNKWGQAGWSNELEGDKITFSKPTGQYDFNPVFKGINAGAQLATGIANRIGDARNAREEQEQWVRALQPQPVYGLSEDGFDDRTMYTKHGGTASRIIEAEEGEVYQTPQGALKKVDEGSGTHEEGGVRVHDAERVLEDTSDKRKDAHSKALLMTPEEVEVMTGHKPKTSLSHSKAMEFAKQQIDKNSKNIQTKLKKNVDSVEQSPTNTFAQNSLKFNMLTLGNQAPEGEVFDALFQHQELTKQTMGIPQSQGKYKVGGPNDEYRTRPPQSKRAGDQWVFDENAPDPDRPWKRVTSSQPSANSGDYRTRPPQSKNAGDNWVFDENAPDPSRPWKRTSTPSASTGSSSSKGDDGYRTRPPQVKAKGDNWVFDENAPDPSRPWKRNRSTGTARGPAQGTVANEMLEDITVSNRLPKRTPFKYVGPGTAPERSVVDNADAAAVATSTDANTIASNRLNFLPPNPPSTFNEPLRWFDVAGPIQNLTEGRIPVNYNSAEMGDVRMKRFNPLPNLQAGQRDYNAALDILPENGQGYSNAANVFSKKYSLDNQTLGQFQNMNVGIDNEEAAKRMQSRTSQSMMDMTARENFERKWLGSKEADRQQKLTAWDDIYTRLAQNRKLNREGNLLMKLYPAFDSYGDYNGYNVPLRNPLSMNTDFMNPNKDILNSTRQQGAGFYDDKGQFQRYEFQGGRQIVPGGFLPTPPPATATGSDDRYSKTYTRPPQSKRAGDEWYVDEALEQQGQPAWRVRKKS